jgi:hypothetical protein
MGIARIEENTGDAFYALTATAIMSITTRT